NSPYRLVQDVVANASGLAFNQFTQTRLKNKIGMKGFWFNYIYYSRIRDMARFGLLLEQEGDWDGEAILADKNYFETMTNTTQDLNPSYGYLTWLNGKEAYMLPALQFVFEDSLVPNAPADMYAALGRDDQKIHVVPSQDLVVVRLGEASELPLFALSPFDNELWGQLNQLMCMPSSTETQQAQAEVKVYPNPASDHLYLTNLSPDIFRVNLYDTNGRLIIQQRSDSLMTIRLADFPAGVYYLQVLNEKGRIVKQERILLMD
ncbi:MAG: T9SS type A sorting domain-containing protein, partial [Bacteroidota bacterium]